MTTYAEILSAVRESLSRRDSRRDLLAQKIVETAEPALSAARVSKINLGSSGVLELLRPVATCSQWADGSSPTTGRGEPQLMLRLGGEIRRLEPIPDLGFWDGRNMQHQQGAAMVEGRRVRAATVAQLRAVARDLPDAVAKLLNDARLLSEAEIADAEAAAAGL